MQSMNFMKCWIGLTMTFLVKIPHPLQTVISQLLVSPTSNSC